MALTRDPFIWFHVGKTLKYTWTGKSCQSSRLAVAQVEQALDKEFVFSIDRRGCFTFVVFMSNRESMIPTPPERVVRATKTSPHLIFERILQMAGASVLERQESVTLKRHFQPAWLRVMDVLDT